MKLLYLKIVDTIVLPTIKQLNADGHEVLGKRPYYERRGCKRRSRCPDPMRYTVLKIMADERVKLPRCCRVLKPKKRAATKPRRAKR